MVSPINRFTIHSLVGFIITISLGTMFYIVYLKAGRRLLDLLAANFIMCTAGVSLTSFLTDNMIPAGMNSNGWSETITAEALKSSTLEIHRFAWALPILLLPMQLHFVLHYCQKHNLLRRYIWVAYCAAILAVPTVWTNLWVTAPAEPLAATSSWGVTIPWLPDMAPIAPLVLLACIITLQVYGLVQLWKSRNFSVKEFASSLGFRKTVFAAFLVQMVIGFGDIIASAMEVPMPALSPVGAGLMGILLAVAMTRSRIDADRTRFQLQSEKIALLECVPQPLLYFGTDHQVQWANDNATAFTGIDSDKIIGSSSEDIWGSASQEQQSIEKAIETGESAKREVVRDDGSTWIVHASPVIGNKGTPTGAIELAMDITEIRQAQKALRESNIKILMAREEERRRVAQDLHDSVAQGLTALQMHLQADAINFGDSTPEQEKFERAAKRCRDLGAEVRQISHQLYPPALDLLGLPTAIEEIFDQYRPIGIECNFACTDELRNMRLARDAEVALYRTGQEAISNAVRHGKAKKISIEIKTVEDELRLSVTDNGGGFDVAANSKGLGLTSMTGRVEGISGRLEITSQPGLTNIQAVVAMEKIRPADEDTDSQPGSESSEPLAHTTA